MTWLISCTRITISVLQSLMLSKYIIMLKYVMQKMEDLICQSGRLTFCPYEVTTNVTYNVCFTVSNPVMSLNDSSNFVIC